jgi:GNAT superfamily N-acetyltransferase
MLTHCVISKKNKNLTDVQKLFRAAFPKEERIPMSFLLQRAAAREDIKFYAYYDDAEFVGFSYLIYYNNLVFALYIAVEGRRHSRGYGAQILERIKQSASGRSIILNIEAEDVSAANNEQRKKRKNFYIKNGFRPAAILSRQKGVTYEMLICGEACQVEEYYALLKYFSGFFWFPFGKPRFVNR